MELLEHVEETRAWHKASALFVVTSYTRKMADSPSASGCRHSIRIAFERLLGRTSERSMSFLVPFRVGRMRMWSRSCNA
eukprot:6088886-Amphidinium_carterae.1